MKIGKKRKKVKLGGRKLNRKIIVLKKPDVTDLAGEKVMIDFETGKYFLLKGVANDIWDNLKSGITIKEICEKLLTEYEVDRQTCEENVKSFLEKMAQYQFIRLE